MLDFKCIDGLVAIHISYMENYETRDWYDSVLLVTPSKNYVISSQDVYKLLEHIRYQKESYQPQVVGLNNYLDIAAGNSWNMFASIDRDSVKFQERDVPLRLEDVCTLLEAVVASQPVNAYRDSTSAVVLRLWEQEYQAYVTKNSEILLMLAGYADNAPTSKVDCLVDLNQDIRRALENRGRLGVYTRY